METTRYYTIVNQAIIPELENWYIKIDGTTAIRTTYSESTERKQMIAEMLKNGDLKHKTIRDSYSAINKGKDVVKAVQDWIFGCDYKKVIRQGDLAMIPVKRLNPAAVALEGEKHLIENSHELTSSDIRKNGELYALNPLLIHLPGTHPTVQATGWYKIVVGKRASHWDFAAPTID